ncbi:MAG: DUF2029 domain-containing protein [Phycisphaerae bacterium]|nr:DUF2029 domain-containing protein [Phycisphaerae bacterium]
MPTRRALNLASWAFLLLASAWFTYRGPVFLASAGNYDFNLVYASSRAWLVGLNPYDRDHVQQAWLAAQGPPNVHPLGPRPSAVLLYPPSAFAALTPFAALPFPIARALWSAANVACILGGILIIARLAGLAGAPSRVFAAIALAFWPTLSALRLGQTPLLVLGLVCLALSSRPGLARGALLGLATAIKPQLALLFIVYDLGRLRWRSGLVGLAVAAALFALGAFRSDAAAIPWWHDWNANLAAFAVGDDGNPTRANAIRHHMINLHYPLHAFTDNRDLVRAAVLAILGGLCLAYFLLDLRRGREPGEGRAPVVSLAMTAAVSLAIVYHRAYDAVFLFFPLALAIHGLARRTPTDPTNATTLAPPRWMHAVTLALVLVHALPTAIALVELAKRGSIPAALTDTTLWRALIVPHQAWALLALVAWLVAIRARSGAVTQRST